MFYAYNELGWSSSTLGLMMSTYGMAMMLGEFAFGRFSDRFGRMPVIIIGLVLFSAQFIGLAFFRNHILIAAAFLIAGLGNALYDPALTASILDISPMEHRARILGIKYTAGSIGNILGPALVVLVTASLSAGSIFLIAVGVVVLGIVAGLAYPVSKRHIQDGSGPHAGTGDKASSLDHISLLALQPLADQFTSPNDAHASVFGHICGQ